MTITITYVSNISNYSVGSTLSTFKVEPISTDYNENHDLNFKTNTVSTGGCKYMTIVFEDFYSSLTDSVSQRDYFKIMSSSGTTLATYQSRQYGTTVKVDVSSASSVYIDATIGAWATHGYGKASVSSIKFGNE